MSREGRGARVARRDEGADRQSVTERMHALNREGRGARVARRDEGADRQSVTEEQRRYAGCMAPPGAVCGWGCGMSRASPRSATGGGSQRRGRSGRSRRWRISAGAPGSTSACCGGWPRRARSRRSRGSAAPRCGRRRDWDRQSKASLPVAPDDPLPDFDPLDDFQAIDWDYRFSAHSTRGHPLAPLREVVGGAGPAGRPHRGGHARRPPGALRRPRHLPPTARHRVGRDLHDAPRTRPGS